MLTALKDWIKLRFSPTYGYLSGFGVALEDIPPIVNKIISKGLVAELEIIDETIQETGLELAVYNVGDHIQAGETIIFTNMKGQLIAQTKKLVLQQDDGDATDDQDEDGGEIGTGTGEPPIGTGTGTGTGSGGSHFNAIKLVRPYKDVIGVGFHRSGWPYAYKYLNIINSNKGILFDDFIEQNFCYKYQPTVYTEPWVGVFHHPPNIPYYGNDRERLQLVFQKAEFIKSAKNLKLAIALSEYLGNFLKENLSCPVHVVKHPSLNVQEKWTPEKFNENTNQQFVQIGYYLRNTQLINQIPISKYAKTRLWIDRPWIAQWDDTVSKYWDAVKTRTNYFGFQDELFVSPSKFDKLLCSNIIVAEVLDASASNGLIDCIMRNTPCMINKHPAVVEYLGEDYPLYFSHPEEIPTLADKIFVAHDYLKEMDKSWADGGEFVRNIKNRIELL